MFSIAERITILLEQVAGGAGGASGGTGGNGGGASNGTGTGNGNGTGNGGEGNGEPTGNDIKDTIGGGFHRHHLGGYGRYYCRCDTDTPRSQQCPNCKARKN